MVEPTSIAQPLDEYLREVVLTLQAAAKQGLSSMGEDPAAADKTIEDCREILDVIMEGNVKEWVN